MRVSLNWLKEYVKIDLPPAELADLLTMSGLEVEALEPLNQSLHDVLVGKILSIKPHPEADRLFICGMDTGNGEVPVVCSAPNLEVGAFVPIALPGTRLPGGLIVEESKIRGERSVGMLLAEDELGLTDDHTGIMILPQGLRPGTRFSEALSIEDWAFEIGITPNRPDCTSVIGIAREIAALTNQKLKRPEIKLGEGGQAIEKLTSVTILDPDGCPRYAAGMIQGIELKPSPFWVRYRLFVSGVRGINNVVDVTNYVMLEVGQPLHAFDYDRLKENRIVVRRAKEGEIFTTLDGQTRNLNGETLMICDGERSVALAGIMGGLNSEIFAGSKNVLVESAYFDPITIRRGAKRLGLSTEASYRFERGIDIEGAPNALRRAMMLMGQFGGGQIIKGIIDNYPKSSTPAVIDLRVNKTNQFLGTSLSQVTIAGYLTALEMEVEKIDQNVIRVKPPTFRVDITREIDLMEEVARLEGYDHILVTNPPIKPSEERDMPELTMGDRMREIMVGLGFTEVITYSFLSPESADLLGADGESQMRSFVKLKNPLTNEQSVMRTSLVPGLLETIKNNVLRGERDLRLFEWGKIFIHNDAEELPQELPILAAIMTGLSNRKEWYREERNVDFYDIKGAVESVLKSFDLVGYAFQKGRMPPYYGPDTSSQITHSGAIIGYVGQASEQVLKGFDLEETNAHLFELDVKRLLERIPERKTFQPFVKFPAVFRDISLVVDRKIQSSTIKEVIDSEGGGLLESVDLYDLYEGGKINSSEKALTFRVSYRSQKGTLDGKEVNRLHETIIERIREKTGGRLREG